MENSAHLGEMKIYLWEFGPNFPVKPYGKLLFGIDGVLAL